MANKTSKQPQTMYGTNRPAAVIRQIAGGDSLASKATAASEVRYDFRFEIRDLNYLHIHEHIAYKLWTLLTASYAVLTCCRRRWKCRS